MIDYTNLYKLIESYGVKGLIMAVVILIIGSIFKSKWISDIWAKITDKVIEWFLKLKTKSSDSAQSVSESTITNHDIFNFIDFWIYSKIPTLQFATEYRNVIFRKYLSIFLKSYKEELMSLVKSGEYKNMDHSELWKTFLNTLNNIVYRYEKDCSDAGIPKIIIDRMKQKNNDTIQLTIDLIENISTSPYYQSQDNLLKVYSILNIILSVLENVVANSKSVCDSINGQLKGLEMDGKKEP